MSKKRQPRYMRGEGKVLTCPCCGRGVDRKDLQKTVGRKVASWGKEWIITMEDLSNFSRNWACDLCIDEGRAILANPDKQKYCLGSPNFAYLDQERQCEHCGRQYIFRKEEQKFWYEELNFWIFSRPKQCPECRKELRYKRELNTELAELLKSDEQATVEQLMRISDIYKEIGNEEKSKMYATKAVKLSRKLSVQENEGKEDADDSEQ